LKENQRLLKEKETKLKEFKISVEQFENNEITQGERLSISLLKK